MLYKIMLVLCGISLIDVIWYDIKYNNLKYKFDDMEYELFQLKNKQDGLNISLEDF